MGSRLNTGIISRKQVSRQTTRDPMGEGRSGSREGSEPVPDVPGSQEEEAVEEGEAQLLHLGGCPGRVALEIGRSWRLGAGVQILWGIRSLGLRSNESAACGLETFIPEMLEGGGKRG